jgi:predicted ATPase
MMDGIALALDPQQRRQKTLGALTAKLEALSHSKPVLMICEDAHWADPTSLEAFGRAADRIRTLPGLLLVTFRPEFDAPWVGQPHVTALTINRLTRREVDALIERVVGNKMLPDNIRHDIIERTDGIPLFVEEMTRAVLEAENQSMAERTVPATLQASLMARLDRLGPAKEVAQIGAAIGREFSHALLAAVVDKPEAQLQSALNGLITAGLLFRQGLSPHANYLFKHALVQDAAYGTLLREPPRTLHARIAATFESDFADIAENQPEVLARHCAAAGLIERAAGLWGKAGQRSLANSALVEAVTQLTRALPRHVTPKRGQTYEPEVAVKMRSDGHFSDGGQPLRDGLLRRRARERPNRRNCSMLVVGPSPLHACACRKLGFKVGQSLLTVGYLRLNQHKP